MRFSPVLKSSPHCLPSPDGRWIATLRPSSVVIREVESLNVFRSIKLSTAFAGNVTTFVWSPSSERILLASAHEIHVFSAADANFHATIRSPSSSTARSTFIDFGATDREACICSAHGIKLSIFNLTTSKVVEISNPKFHTTVSAARGFSFRRRTHHLALLTRTSGRDTISIHSPDSREVQRSWNPDVIDAQGLSWTPDGKWLAVWESASQGHKVLFFTPDGHKYRDWCGPLQHASGEVQDRLGAGVKLVAFSADSQYMAIGDFSRCISVLHTSITTQQLLLHHPTVLEPKDTVQIWQEQIDSASKGDVATFPFVQASQPVSPPGRAPGGTSELKSGPHTILFDCSAALVAVILDDAPSTLWIWDVSVVELRAVLMFHSEISRVEWHPVQSELLFVKCEGNNYNGVIFIWDPLSGGPQTMDFRSLLPDRKTGGKSSVFWLKSNREPASLFFADGKNCLLGSLADTDEEALPWQEHQPTPSINMNQPTESPLDIMPGSAEESDESSDLGVGELDDTFHFKKNGIE
ncbi:uncharacterized protein JN550_000378 [Neoarthrinium moseri]|uniref:uncharacterized protein n=1 Tax=Neoarthrinium moseri TaxID=1658444 RepID=UPI001FDC6BA0|nr:uncharacterized protein JN550_000378 [Neoarthrinium moseri]KAI1878196.1 hypothetical protein JN550_000378 [Neoarthrinium moseri]